MLESMKCTTGKTRSLPSGSGAHGMRPWELYFDIVWAEMWVIFSGSQRPRRPRHLGQVIKISSEKKNWVGSAAKTGLKGIYLIQALHLTRKNHRLQRGEGICWGQAPPLNWQRQDQSPVLLTQEKPGFCLIGQVQVHQSAITIVFRGSRKVKHWQIPISIPWRSRAQSKKKKKYRLRNQRNSADLWILLCSLGQVI